jgi:preprotein translocase subunit SecD
LTRLLLLVVVLGLCAGCGSARHVDCSGGGEIVLHAIPQHGEPLTPAGMELARTMIVNRVTSIGVGSPTVKIRGNDEIVISGTPVPKSLVRVVYVPGNLQFFDFENDLAAPTVKNGNPTPYPTLYSLLTAVKGEANYGTPEAYYLIGSSAPHRVLDGPAGTRDELLSAHGGKQPTGTTILAVPANREVVSGMQAQFTASTSPVGNSPDGTYWFLFKLPAEINSGDLNKSNISAGSDPNTGAPQVTLGFTRHGAKEFQAITKDEYARGQLVAGLHGSAGQLNQLYAQHNAIVLDGHLKVVPYIDYTDNALSLGIAGASAVISNMGSSDAAKNFALVLQSGSLPYRFEQVSSKLCRR